MRLAHPDGQLVHLGFCTNVHPAEELAGILAQLDSYAVPVREHLDVDVLSLGLWLAAEVAAELAADPARRRQLLRELDARGLEVVTLNGFPYRSFQAPVVKHAVYQPDWTSRQRLDYTLDLAWILADLLPDDAARGLEPEPGCVIETTRDAERHLSDIDTQWLGICLDLAHLACAWEDPGSALARLAGAGLPVVKVQVSAALGADDPATAGETLRRYAEPRFLHQTRGPDGHGTDGHGTDGHGTDDLGSALDAGLPGPWRVHCHVPLHAAPAPPLHATLPVLRDALRELLGGPAAGCDHFEVETYTWGVRTSPGSSRSPQAGLRPCRAVLRPAAPMAARTRAAVTLARKKLGMRYLMNVVGLDAGADAVRGSHGRLPTDPADSPVLLCSDASAARERVEAIGVKELLLGLAGATG